MVLRAAARPQGGSRVGREQPGFAAFAAGVSARGLRAVSRANGPRIQSGDGAGSELSTTQRLSSAYGNGDRICDTSGIGDVAILRGDGRAIAEVCVVQQERAG